MRIVMFYHSLLSDWSHGHAHFLRGVVSELLARGHDVAVYEPAGGWSLSNLLLDQSEMAIIDFQRAYPGLQSWFYDPATLDLERVLDGADLVLVHAWTLPELVARIGRHRALHGGYALLFHDSHRPTAGDGWNVASHDLSHYDGVLAPGDAIRERYEQAGWQGSVWTWRDAADTHLFKPLPDVAKTGDLVWIGNWGDDQRAQDLTRFLLEPAVALGVRALVHGVRYPDLVLKALAAAGIEYGGWLANFRGPQVFARHRVTIHVPRRSKVEPLAVVPSIRMYEALACGIPLVCAPGCDGEGVFTAGRDYLLARGGEQMRQHLYDLLNDPAKAAELAERGRRTVLERHTCAHRVDELLDIHRRVRRAPLEAMMA